MISSGQLYNFFLFHNKQTTKSQDHTLCVIISKLYDAGWVVLAKGQEGHTQIELSRRRPQPFMLTHRAYQLVHRYNSIVDAIQLKSGAPFRQ